MKNEITKITLKKTLLCSAAMALLLVTGNSLATHMVINFVNKTNDDYQISLVSDRCMYDVSMKHLTNLVIKANATTTHRINAKGGTGGHDCAHVTTSSTFQFYNTKYKSDFFAQCHITMRGGKYTLRCTPLASEAKTKLIWDPSASSKTKQSIPTKITFEPK